MYKNWRGSRLGPRLAHFVLQSNRCILGKKLLDYIRIEFCGVDCLRQPDQIALWVQILFNGSLDHGRDHSAALGSIWGVGKQEVLTVNYKGLYTALSTVITELQPANLEVIGQLHPLLLEIGQRFALSSLWRCILDICP